MSNDPTTHLPREYRSRMRWALAAALALHAFLLLVPVGCPNAGSQFVPAAPKEQPIVVTLRPPEEPKSLIDPGAPTEQPVDPATNLIAERNSKAQDMSSTDTNGTTPDAGAVGPVDAIAPTRAPVAQPPAPSPPAVDAPPAPKPPKKAPTPDPVPAPKANPAPKPMEAVDTAKPVSPPAPEENKPQDAAIIVAKAETPPLPERTTGQAQSRVEGGVKSKGFLSYEAMESDFAPYLRQVRDRVEKRWKALIHMRYSGTASTKAVLDCAITPDGKITAVTIAESGDSATFAGLCQQAIEQAGPFGPFPFTVPEMYRNQNIEIRWTFSFL